MASSSEARSVTTTPFLPSFFLSVLEKQNIVTFSKILRKNEGKKGVVVTLLASLELAKDGYIELIQNKSEELFLKLTGI